MAKLRRYVVPVSWITYGQITVEAASKEEAFRIAQKAAPEKYMSRSFEIDLDSIELAK